jgi:hypothetical protein
MSIISDDLKQKIEKLYCRTVTSAYLNKCHFRRIVNIVFDDGRKSIMYGKLLLQIKYGRIFNSDETCDHVDGDPMNDSIDNLQLLSRSENAIKGGSDATKLRLSIEKSNRMSGVKQPNNDGEKNGQSKLSNEQVAEIKELQKTHYKGQDSVIAKQYNVSRSTIKGIRHNYFRCNG